MPSLVPAPRPGRLRISALALAGAAALFSGAAPAALAATAPADTRSSTSEIVRAPVTLPETGSPDATARARAHWTPERMAAASLASAAADDDAVPTSSGPSSRPAAQPLAASAATAAPPISIAQRVTPVSHIGRIFYTLNGQDYACSANVVKAANRSTVATAAHCMTAKGAFATDAVFVPGYHDGDHDGDYGTWPVVGGVVAGGYTEDNDDLGDDAGFEVVALDADGRNIQSVVGASPVLFDQPLVKEGTVYGYPAARRFDGESLQRCRGVFQRESADQINLPCDMNEGVSGGPIFAGDDANGAQYADEDARYDDYSHILGPIWQANEHTAYDGAARIQSAEG